MQNQKLLKEMMMDGLANTELKKQEIRVKAQINEYMFDMLTRYGNDVDISGRLDNAFVDTQE